MKLTTVNVISELVGSDTPVEYQEEPRGISQFFLICTGCKAYVKIALYFVRISFAFNEFLNNLLGEFIKVIKLTFNILQNIKLNSSSLISRTQFQCQTYLIILFPIHTLFQHHLSTNVAKVIRS